VGADRRWIADALEREKRGDTKLSDIAIAPSASPVYRSVADALASGDASKLSPGESNLDWRRWLRFDDGKVKPPKRRGR
jgi:hypothetical protein